MKLTALFVLLSLFFVSCTKDKIQPPPPALPEIIPPQEYLIVGDSISNDIHFVSYTPEIILENSTNDVLTHYLDADSDGINDFQLSLYSYFAFANTWYKGTSIKVKTLHANAEVSKDPLYTNPLYPYAEQYFENDSLEQQEVWASGEFFLSTNGDILDSCDAPGCPMTSSGDWFGINNQYIGVRLHGANLGWIKISLPVNNPNSEQILIVQQYGFDL